MAIKEWIVRRRIRSAARRISSHSLLGLCLLGLASPSLLFAADATRRFPVALQPDDLIPTGNEWIALPDIRATDGALTTFNALSMRYRGLLQVTGEQGAPVIQPYFEAAGQPVPFRNPSWDLIEYWIPTAHQTTDGVEMTLTWCAPPGVRAAFLHMTVTNRRAQAVPVSLGVQAHWGGLERVTYNPVELQGQRTMSPVPWLDSGEVFSFITSDTRFAWSLIHPDSQATMNAPPVTLTPEVDAEHAATLAPGQTAEANFILGVGLEEFSAGHNAHELGMLLDRFGADAVIAKAAAWARSHTRTTGNPALDMIMNRNFLFTAQYAWGRTIDTEQWVGVTSRSPRYYVSAAYWDRDAMLWSFPGLLDSGPDLARQALEVAYTTQLRDTGTHSRFIDGTVLEDGFELDEAVAPLVALSEYVDRTHDSGFLRTHRDGVMLLLRRAESRYDPATGLYSSLQDAQDEFQKLPFITYDNVLVWKAFLDTASLFDRLQDPADGNEARQRAASLRAAILKRCVANGAPNAGGPIFVEATDGRGHNVFADVPPGSLMKLPILGFVPESNPIFQRTYRWLHSSSYQYSYAGTPYGVPGSYRLPETTSWLVADELRLSQGKQQAMNILLASHWDGGIVTEGLNPETAAVGSGNAFATAAGYVADAICRVACRAPAPDAASQTPAAGEHRY